MGNFELFGKWLVIIGLVIVISGGLVWLAGRLGFNQFPGTLRINLPGGQCVIPILASIVLSILLTLILNLILRLLK
jgi:uncharacterized membrane protein YidH (DUF202 family)